MHTWVQPALLLCRTAILAFYQCQCTYLMVLHILNMQNAGMLSKVLPLRRAQAAFEQAKYDSLPPAERANYAMPLQPLKLIIMSATMRVNDFQNPRLFPAALPPIIKVGVLFQYYLR